MAATDVIRSGGVDALSTLLEGHPGLAAGRIGDDTTSCTLLHVAEWSKASQLAEDPVPVPVPVGPGPDP